MTPELALVDPELARRARAALPVLEPPRRRAAHRGTITPVAPPRASVAEALPAAAPARRRRRRLRAVGAVLALALGFAAGGAVADHPWWRTSASREPAAPTARTRAEQPASPATERTVGSVPASATEQSPTPTAAPARVRPARSRATSAKRRPHVLRVAPHSFAWIRVPRATYYLLRIYRGPRLIFAAEPRANRIVLPASWTFAGRTHRLAGGRYRWSVRPGFGAPAAKRYGREIVRAALVVQ